MHDALRFRYWCVKFSIESKRHWLSLQNNQLHMYIIEFHIRSYLVRLRKISQNIQSFSSTFSVVLLWWPLFFTR